MSEAPQIQRKYQFIQSRYGEGPHNALADRLLAQRYEAIVTERIRVAEEREEEEARIAVDHEEERRRVEDLFSASFSYDSEEQSKVYLESLLNEDSGAN